MLPSDFPNLRPDAFEHEEDYIAAVVYQCCLHIHQTMGPGLMESAYERILEIELLEWGFDMQRQQKVDAFWRGENVGLGYIADLVINELVIVELKSIKELIPVNYKQVLTYIRLEDKRLGLLINFGAAVLKGNFKRVVNGLW